MLSTLEKESSSIVSFHSRCVTAGAWGEYANGPLLQKKRRLVSKLQDFSKNKQQCAHYRGDEKNSRPDFVKVDDLPM